RLVRGFFTGGAPKAGSSGVFPEFVGAVEEVVGDGVVASGVVTGSAVPSSVFEQAVKTSTARATPTHRRTVERIQRIPSLCCSPSMRSTIRINQLSDSSSLAW